eukprot:1458154-Rhodomonas_salina.2
MIARSLRAAARPGGAGLPPFMRRIPVPLMLAALPLLRTARPSMPAALSVWAAVPGADVRYALLDGQHGASGSK